MISISNDLKLAQESISRTVDAYVMVNDTRYNTDKLVKFSFEDTIMPEGGFSIGNAISNNISVEIIEEEGIVKNGDSVEVFIGMQLANSTYEYVSLGKFIIGELTHSGKVVTFKAFDKLYFTEGEYISTITTFPTTSNLVIQDVCTQLGLQLANTGLEDISIQDKMSGYKIREVIGILAGLHGYNAKINRVGKLELITYPTQKIIINPDTYFTTLKANPITLTGFSNYFGDFANSVGDGTGSIVTTSNQYITEAQMNTILTKFAGMSYSPCDELRYRGFTNIQAGDTVELLDIRDNVVDIYVTTHILEYTGGLIGIVKSSGLSKTDNAFVENKIKGKKSLTELKIELGIILAKVQEFEELENDITAAYTAAIEIMKDNINIGVSEEYTKISDTILLEEKLSSDINATARDIDFTFTKVTNEINDDLQEYKEEVSTNIRFNADGMELGKSNSEFKAKLTNTELAFLQNEEKVAYINNNKMYITDAEVTNQLTLGSFAFIPRTNGNLSLKFIK